MRETEYRRTRKEIESEIRAAEGTLAKVQAKLAALDLLWRDHFSHQHGCDAGPAAASESSENTTQRIAVVNGQAQLMIDEAATSMTGDFGVREIGTAIHSRHPDKTINRTTIAGRLRKLVDDGRLSQIEAGRGRRPGSFRRVA